LYENDGITTMEYTAGILAKSLAEEMPEVQYGVSIVPASWFSNKGIVSMGDNHIRSGGQYIGKDYFNVFTCNFIQGDKNKILTDKYAIGISQELAMKLFHTTENILGKTVDWEEQEFGGKYSISGIFEKNPSNATAQFDLLFNYDLFMERRPGLQSWGNSDPSTYIILEEGTNIDKFNNKIRGFVKSKAKDEKKTLFVQRYSERYLHGQYINGKIAGGRILYVRLFSIIALFILVIAAINFMNLSTAKASGRMKEVGIKKVMGARRVTLIFQYLSESVLLSFLSLILSVVLILILLPSFNQITGKQLELHFSTRLLLTVLCVTLITGLISGSYPALYLSGFRPVAVLKGKLKTSAGERWVRKGLVVFQFTLSVIFIVAVLVVYRQMQYIQTKNLGYNRNNLVHFEIPFGMEETQLKKAELFVNELKNIPGVVNASSYYHNLTGDHGGISGLEWEGKVPHTDIEFANLEVGLGFIEAAGIQMKEGHSFSKNLSTEKQIIFNEAAIDKMGLKNPVGKTVRFWGQEKQIVGIAKNFHFESLYETVKPCFFQVYPALPNVLVRIQPGTEKQTIAGLQKFYLAFNKGLAFDYKFLDEDYRLLYASETRVASLSRYFTGLAIIISCLGLFGLAAFTAQKRQKEIGIRKVVGATVSNVIIMLSKDFLKLVLIALLIALPLVWWMMNRWLNSFAYRINMGADIFLLASCSIVLITLVTISFQAIKAAIANPVQSLRTE
jgi:ABC-type antimicrobial peptide transport system permease subunit